MMTFELSRSHNSTRCVWLKYSDPNPQSSHRLLTFSLAQNVTGVSRVDANPTHYRCIESLKKISVFRTQGHTRLSGMCLQECSTSALETNMDSKCKLHVNHCIKNCKGSGWGFLDCRIFTLCEHNVLSRHMYMYLPLQTKLILSCRNATCTDMGQGSICPPRIPMARHGTMISIQRHNGLKNDTLSS
jgi:hypothetical protein